MVGIMANVASAQNIRQYGIMPDMLGVRETAKAQAASLYENTREKRRRGMSKSEYGNPLGNQALSLPDMADAQLEACFDEKTLSGLMSMAEIFNVRKIFITGCGDSIAAAGAFAGVMRKFTGAFHCEMIEPMEFTRFLKKEEAGIGEPDSPLVIAISAGGGTAGLQRFYRRQTGWRFHNPSDE